MGRERPRRTNGSAGRADAGLDVRGQAVYMIGIGGCGMAGLARMLVARGARVQGSDQEASATTDALAGAGIAVGLDQSREWLPGDCELVVASAAIKPDHPQVRAAAARGLTVLSYAQALGRSMSGRTGVAIAGTHGKSTTTAMLGAALVDAGLDPTVIVGATCGQLTRGALSQTATEPVGFRLGADTIPCGLRAGTPGLLVAEACEFNRSFHNFHPVVASVSSVEADHLDIYGSLDAVVEAFHEFARRVNPGGTLLIAHQGAHRKEVAAGLECEVQTIGLDPEADWVVSFDPGTRGVHLTRRDEPVASWTMRVPGTHNAVNAATAAALAIILGADPGTIGKSLSAFRGVDRRCQFLGERMVDGDGARGPVRVYDDYGHHPTEVEATLRALRQHERPELRAGRLICVFQPHQHSRTRHLLEEFAAAFASADVVIVPHIYFVRDSEAEKQSVSAADLVDRLRDRGVRAMHLYPFEAIVEQLEQMCRPGDLVVVMGAGPVWQVARGFMEPARPSPRAAGVIEPTGAMLGSAAVAAGE